MRNFNHAIGFRIFFGASMNAHAVHTSLLSKSLKRSCIINIVKLKRATTTFSALLAITRKMIYHSFVVKFKQTSQKCEWSGKENFSTFFLAFVLEIKSIILTNNLF